jgi:hypothetical protein
MIQNVIPDPDPDLDIDLDPGSATLFWTRKKPAKKKKVRKCRVFKCWTFFLEGWRLLL